MKCECKKEKQFKYSIISEDGERIKVVELKDNFVWGHAESVKGAVIGALVSGVRLGDIDFNGHYVPIRECLEVVK